MYTVEELYIGKVLSGDPDEDELEDDDDLENDDDLDEDEEEFKEQINKEFPLSGGETDEDLERALR